MAEFVLFFREPSHVGAVLPLLLETGLHGHDLGHLFLLLEFVEVFGEADAGDSKRVGDNGQTEVVTVLIEESDNVLVDADE